MGRYPELSLSGVRTTSLTSRDSLVSVRDFVNRDSLRGDAPLLSALPDILAGRAFRAFVEDVVSAATGGRRTVALIGGHVIKTGVSPCLIELLEANVLTAVAGNGSVAIHDVEIALAGHTSESVETGLKTGDFGVATETAAFLNEAAIEARERREGFGEALGRRLVEAKPPFVDQSLLAAAYRKERPFTLHVAIGTDIVHQHPDCDGAAIGEATLRDFRILAGHLGGIDRGVVLNVGSAVILPEVFVKALNLARNLGHPSPSLVTANFDFIQHYRPRQNVLHRPTSEGGRAYAFTGHHELLVPFLTQAVLARLEDGNDSRSR